MNNNVKLSVTILGIPGATRRKVGVKKICREVTKQDLTTKKLPPEIGQKVVAKKWFKIPVYEEVTCSQKINMTQAAYDYFTSSEAPSFADRKAWGRMNKTQRLEAHLYRTMQHFRGTSFTYNIFED